MCPGSEDLQRQRPQALDDLLARQHLRAMALYVGSDNIVQGVPGLVSAGVSVQRSTRAECWRSLALLQRHNRFGLACNVIFKLQGFGSWWWVRFRGLICVLPEWSRRDPPKTTGFRVANCLIVEIVHMYAPTIDRKELVSPPSTARSRNDEKLAINTVSTQDEQPRQTKSQHAVQQSTGKIHTA